MNECIILLAPIVGALAAMIYTYIVNKKKEN